MRVTALKVLAASFGIAAALGVAGGLAFAAFAQRRLWYGIGTGLFLVGLITLSMGLLGATEPPDGWVTGRGATSAHTGRRSLLARLVEDDPDFEPLSSWAYAAWGVVVGGALIALSMGAFALS